MENTIGGSELVRVVLRVQLGMFSDTWSREY